MSLEAFENDWQRQWLVERSIEIVSEASRHLTDELKELPPRNPLAKSSRHRQCAASQLRKHRCAFYLETRASRSAGNRGNLPCRTRRGRQAGSTRLSRGKKQARTLSIRKLRQTNKVTFMSASPFFKRCVGVVISPPTK